MSKINASEPSAARKIQAGVKELYVSINKPVIVVHTELIPKPTVKNKPIRRSLCRGVEMDARCDWRRLLLENDVAPIMNN
jgi:hypothetical protein